MRVEIQFFNEQIVIFDCKKFYLLFDGEKCYWQYVFLLYDGKKLIYKVDYVLNLMIKEI